MTECPMCLGERELDGVECPSCLGSGKVTADQARDFWGWAAAVSDQAIAEYERRERLARGERV